MAITNRSYSKPRRRLILTATYGDERGATHRRMRGITLEITAGGEIGELRP